MPPTKLRRVRCFQLTTFGDLFQSVPGVFTLGRHITAELEQFSNVPAWIVPCCWSANVTLLHGPVLIWVHQQWLLGTSRELPKFRHFESEEFWENRAVTWYVSPPVRWCSHEIFSPATTASILAVNSWNIESLSMTFTADGKRQRWPLDLYSFLLTLN